MTAQAERRAQLHNPFLAKDALPESPSLSWVLMGGEKGLAGHAQSRLEFCISLLLLCNELLPSSGLK